MPTEIQPTPTAAGRRDATLAEIAALQAADAAKVEAITAAMVNGDDTAQLNAERLKIAARLQDLSFLERRLSRLALKDDLQQLNADAAAAQARQIQLGQQIAAKTEQVNAKFHDYTAAEEELARLKNQTSGVYSCNLRLEQFRKLHPEIEDTPDE